jgi:NAD(P)-dependent dehydrogenase (short-subunit alcohol dehydrogenase family)
MQSHDSTHRTVVITGANSGLGLAALSYFHDHGWQIAALDIVHDFHVSLDGVTVIRCDVSDRACVEKAVASASQALGQIGAVVHCAATNTSGALHETSAAEWNRCMRVNADGTFHLLSAVLPRMIDAGGGAVVNVSSITAERSMRKVAAYSASKGAVTALTLSVARDYAPYGIRANVVHPGTFDSPMVRQTFAARDKDVHNAMSRAAAAYPLGRLGRPTDVVPMLHFLASPESSWITGAVYVVDGGVSSVAGV